MVAAVMGFAVVAGLLTMVPGIDTALVLRSSVSNGPRAAYGATAGICLGLLVWGIAAAVGVSALLAASQLAYNLLRLAGAAYLIGLGVHLIWTARKVPQGGPAPDTSPAAPVSAFRRGLLTNLLNPKIGVFYIAVLPQFLVPGVPQLLTGVVLAMVHVVESLVWFSLLIWGTQALRSRLERPQVKAWVDRITGSVLIGFGAKVAFSRP